MERKIPIFFLGLEKSHQTSNVIKELKIDNGNTVKTDNEILGQMCSYYEKLYQSKNRDDLEIDNYLSNSNIPQLSPTEKETCEFFPSIDECKEAVLNMKPNKSPGLDG